MRAILPALALVASTSALSEVTDSAPNGFTTVHEVTIDAPRAEVWTAALEIGRWWSDNHTISGDARRMTIDAQPQGCFCELLGRDAGVVHLTVTSVNPTVWLKLTGGLGPLGLMGVSGNMSWEFEDADRGTTVRFIYAVGGYRPGGLDEIAGGVDYVIGEALSRLKARVETGDPDNIG